MTQLALTPLGGVGTFGRNALLVQRVDADGPGPALIVDCGVRFLGEDGRGFDVGLPDLDAVAALGDRLLGYVVTHGHEDHVGALPYAHHRNPAPLFATPFTRHVIARRFRRVGVPLGRLDVVTPGETRTLGPFTVRWLAVSHSIPDATAVCIETDGLRLVHSGDFRVDTDPLVGPPTDVEGLTTLGDAGVDVLLADSTGAASPGDNAGEASVVAPLVDIARRASGRVFLVTFASHLQRVAAAGVACRESGRRLVLLGRGLVDTLRSAREVGYAPVDDVVLPRGELRAVHPDKVLYVATGSQGEPNSAIAKLARGEHPDAAVRPGDEVVWSARVIPGNERPVARVWDALAARGATVARGPHVSGHGRAGDLEVLLAATRPRHFVALHGGGHQLRAHRALAAAAGLDEGHVLDLTDGGTLALDDDGVRALEAGPRREPFAKDGVVCDDPAPLVAMRQRMGTAGCVVVRVDDDAETLHLDLHAVYPRPSAAALAGWGARGYRAFARGEAPEELSDGTPAEGLATWLGARFREVGAGQPEVIVLDGGLPPR